MTLYIYIYWQVLCSVRFTSFQPPPVICSHEVRSSIQGLDLLFCLIDISAKTPVLGVFSHGDKKGNFKIERKTLQTNILHNKRRETEISYYYNIWPLCSVIWSVVEF